LCDGAHAIHRINEKTAGKNEKPWLERINRGRSKKTVNRENRGFKMREYLPFPAIIIFMKN
jgi:hypothetical protein